jgi:tetratricopeptide (TPR) repeat protein
MMGHFVGRKAELAALETALGDAHAGRGRLVFLVGEPGIGKTRLADEFCARAGRSVRVLWGRCWEAGGAPAFWPWIEVLRPLLAEGDPAALASELGADAVLVAALLPELRQKLLGLPAEAPTSSSERARFLLFDAVARFLRARAGRAPMVVVLDDVHAADEPSLRLLEFVARGLRGMPLLVIATYRDADARLVPETSRILANAERDGERLTLHRLHADEVRELIESSTGAAAVEGVLDAVVRVTEGTPLFVNEVVRLVIAEGAPAVAGASGRIVVPDGLGPAIRGHLARVSDATRATLRTAAVIGRDFSMTLLCAVEDATEDSTRIGERLAEAERAKLIVDLAAEPPRYRFSHILVRETIYRDLGTVGRQRLHGQVARALVSSTARVPEAGTPAIGLAEIAHHFLRAGEEGRKLGAEYARRAGEHALDVCAHEQARAHFQEALRAHDETDEEARRARAEILLKLADAQLRGGDRARSWQNSERAAEVARELGDWALFADAALRRGAEFTFGQVDGALAALLDEALAALGDARPAVRARLMARLAAARQPAPDPEQPIALAQQAIALARDAGDRGALAAVIRDARAAYLPMDSLEQRLALDLEALSLAYETGDKSAAIHAHRRLTGDRLEEGEVSGALGHLDQYERLADELCEPHRKAWSLATRAAIATLKGAFAEAEELLARVDSMSEGEPQARDAAGFARFTLCWTARRDAELATADSILARESARRDVPELGLFRMVARGRMGDLAFVRAAWKNVHPRAVHPRMGGKNYLAELAALIGDRDVVERHYRWLLPWADRFIGYFGCEGSYARVLGILAGALGNVGEARRHFEHALAQNQRIGAVPWVAHTLTAYADMLTRTGEEGDARRAAELRQRAVDIAERLGMPALLGSGSMTSEGSRGAALAVGIAPAPEGGAARDAGNARASRDGAPPPAEASRGDPAFDFRLEGEYWTLRVGEQSFRLKDNKGLQLVAYLVEHPDREFHVLHLTAVADGAGGAEALFEPGVAGGPDATARSAYRARLLDLKGELDQAEANRDMGRAERARHEMALLTDEIGRGLGLHGRERAAGGSVERARVNVQRRISDALRKIENACPPLGRHLGRSIRTGTYCVYSNS